MPYLNPELDGVDHINIYSKGKTYLGQFLSNFTQANIETAEGTFKSIEGYWYWLSNGQDVMRDLYGYKAKQEGKKYPRIYQLPDETFKAKIKQACWYKMVTTDWALREMYNSTLPFTHYYVFGNGVVKDAGHKWLVEMWEFYRQHVKTQWGK